MRSKNDTLTQHRKSMSDTKYHGQENKDAIALAIGKIVMAGTSFTKRLGKPMPRYAAETNGTNHWTNGTLFETTAHSG
jgi:hypothetical protein